MERKGMSLITLIITIVIMIIIAGVTIVNLSSTDIVGKANKAVNDYNLKNVEQLANMAYANVYFNNLTKGIRREPTVEEIINSMLKNDLKEEELEPFNIEVEDGNVLVSIKGQDT